MKRTIALSVIYLAVIFGLLASQAFLHNENEWDRAFVVIIASATTVVAWLRLRKRFSTRVGLATFALPLLELALACCWSAANFFRYHLYGSAIGSPRSGAAAFHAIVQAQTVLEWLAAVVGIAFVIVSIVATFRSVASSHESTESPIS